MNTYCVTGYTDGTGKVEYFGDETYVSLRTAGELPIKYDASDIVTQNGIYEFSAKLRITDDAFDYAKMHLGLRVTDESGTRSYTSRSFNITHDYVTCNGEAEITFTGKIKKVELYIANSTKNEYNNTYITDVGIKRIENSTQASEEVNVGALYLNNTDFFDTESIGVTRMRAELDYAAYAGIDFFVYSSVSDGARHCAENTDIKFCFLLTPQTSQQDKSQMSALINSSVYLEINGRKAVFAQNGAQYDGLPANVIFLTNDNTVSVKSDLSGHTENAQKIKNAYLQAENTGRILIIDAWNTENGLVPSATHGIVDISRIEALRAVLEKGKTVDIIRSLKASSVDAKTPSYSLSDTPSLNGNTPAPSQNEDETHDAASTSDRENSKAPLNEAGSSNAPKQTKDAEGDIGNESIDGEHTADDGENLKEVKKKPSAFEWTSAIVYLAISVSVMSIVKIISVRRKKNVKKE